MALESEVKIKVLDEYIETLKQDLLFSMAEIMIKSENKNRNTITIIKRELDKAAQERMRLSQIHHSNINNSMALTAASA